MLIVRRSILRDAPASGYKLSRSRDDRVTHPSRNENVTLPDVFGTTGALPIRRRSPALMRRKWRVCGKFGTRFAKKFKDWCSGRLPWGGGQSSSQSLGNSFAIRQACDSRHRPEPPERSSDREPRWRKSGVRAPAKNPRRERPKLL